MWGGKKITAPKTIFCFQKCSLRKLTLQQRTLNRIFPSGLLFSFPGTLWWPNLSASPVLFLCQVSAATPPPLCRRLSDCPTVSARVSMLHTQSSWNLPSAALQQVCSNKLCYFLLKCLFSHETELLVGCDASFVLSPSMTSAWWSELDQYMLDESPSMG